MITVEEGRVRFNFPRGWRVSRFDRWTYYRSYAKIHPGIKAVDLLALSPDDTLYIIEVKDFRSSVRTKEMPLDQELILKVCWTMSVLLPASMRSNSPEEAEFARMALRALNVRVVAHIEHHRFGRKLFNPQLELFNLTQKLRQRLKPVDPHPMVVDAELTALRPLGWTVELLPHEA